MPVFKTGAFVRSANPPGAINVYVVDYAKLYYSMALIGDGQDLFDTFEYSPNLIRIQILIYAKGHGTFW